MNTLGFYDNYIQNNFVTQHCGIDLKQIGKVTEEIYFPVKSIEQLPHESYTVRERLKPIVQFLEGIYLDTFDWPLWYRINVADQAINQYIGIGLLNMENDWIKFILDYLCNDPAEQGGDTILVIFDTDFRWSVCFTLSCDTERLIIEKRSAL